MPTVSVIMPVWGAEEFIESSVASVLDQDFTDLELILVDDCSPDRSLELAAALVARRGEQRVRTIRRDSNGGVSAARNTGLDHARGEFVCFIDNDDQFPPGALSTLVTAIRAEPGLDLVIGRPERLLADGRLLRPEPVPGWPVTVPGTQAALLSLYDRVSCFPWDKIYRRRLFDRLRFPEGMLYEDMVLTTLSCLASERVRLLPDVVYRYVIRAGSQTWKDLPPTRDLDRAVHLLADAVAGGGPDRPLELALLRRRLLMTLILAQRALLRRGSTPQAAPTLAHCRALISLRDVLRVLPRDRFIAAAALGLKLLPGPYGAIYRRYARRTFGIET